MSSKSDPQAQSNPNSQQEQSHSQSSQPSQRPPRVKMIPKKLHDGADRSIPGVSGQIPNSTPKALSATPTRSKGVSFKEPVTSPTDNREEGLNKRTGRRKPKTKRASNDEPDQTKEAPRKKKKKTSRNIQEEVPTRGESSAVPEASNEQNQQNQQEQQQEQPEQPSSVMPNAIVDIYRSNSPSGDFDITTTGLRADFNAKFKESYAKRPCCAVVVVDLEKIYKEFDLDLSP